MEKIMSLPLYPNTQNQNHTSTTTNSKCLSQTLTPFITFPHLHIRIYTPTRIVFSLYFPPAIFSLLFLTLLHLSLSGFFAYPAIFRFRGHLVSDFRSAIRKKVFPSCYAA